MAARKIKPQPYSITGVQSFSPFGSPQEFESHLELMALVVLLSDPGVERILTQPVTIDYLDEDGNPHKYTPDLQVFFRPGEGPTPASNSVFAEIKPKAILERDRDELAPKFRAAGAFAEACGATFVVLTDSDILTPFLPNAQLLNRYRDEPKHDIREQALLTALAAHGHMRVNDLLESVRTTEAPEVMIRSLWRLVRIRQVWANLAQQLSMESVVRLPHEGDKTFSWDPNGLPCAGQSLAAPAGLWGGQAESAAMGGGGEGRVQLKPGAAVSWRGKPLTIMRTLDLRTVLARETGTGELNTYPIPELEGPAASTPAPHGRNVALELVAEEDWKIAERRAEVLRPLLKRGAHTTADVETAARQLGFSRATCYRKLKDFDESGGMITALLPKKPNGGRNKHRLDPRVEEVLATIVNKVVLGDNPVSMAEAYRKLELACAPPNEQLALGDLSGGLPVPHPNTLRRRVAMLSKWEIAKANGSGKDLDRLTPCHGEYLDARYPLEIIQIDHTKTDILLVDEYGNVIGRVYLTLAIDVYSRVVLGHYLGLEEPGTTALACCVAEAMCPKDKLLSDLGLNTTWDAWGKAQYWHTDCAEEMVGKSFRRASEKWGISLINRGLQMKEQGGTIERLMNTFMHEIHALPGTTKSSIADRGDYPSAKKAVMTLADLEKWMVLHIAGDYNLRAHEGIGGQSPIERFREGIIGRRGQPGVGIPDRLDPRRVLLDFLPSQERALRRDGIEIHGLTYTNATVRAMFKKHGGKQNKEERSIVVRWDPRNIKWIYIWNPDRSDYEAVPTRNIAFKPISLWEWRAKTAEDRARFKRQIPTPQIFLTRRAKAAIVEKAQTTMLEHRRRAKRRVHEAIGCHGVDPSEAARLASLDYASVPPPDVNPYAVCKPFDKNL